MTPSSQETLEQSELSPERQSDTSLPASASAEPLSWFSVVLLSLLPLLTVVYVWYSQHPWISLLKSLSVLVSATSIFVFLLYRLSDPGVSKDFLVKQTFIAAVPTYILVGSIELFITISAWLLVFSKDLVRLHKLKNPTPKEVSQIFSNFPIWKLLTLKFIFAYFVAALCEEGAKYLLARRWKHTRCSGIGGKGIVAVSTAAGLGLATTEHFMAVVFLGVLSSFVRAFMAFPVHCGTAAYIGTRMAENRLGYGQGCGTLSILLFPILVHGTFDLTAFVLRPFVARHRTLRILAPSIQVVIVLILLFVVYKRFQRLLQMEFETESMGVV